MRPTPSNWCSSATWGSGAPTSSRAASNSYYSTPNEAAFDGLDEDLLNFVNDPNVIPGGVSSLEEIQDTGDFETEYSDAFIEAKG